MAREPGRPAAPALLIRPLAADDLDAISGVHCRACRVAYRFMGWAWSEDEVRRWYADKLAAWDWARVACADRRVVGYLVAIGPHVDQLFVDPDHQRAGVGRSLLGAMLARGLRPATLQVFALNAPARRFYEGFGFRPVAEWWNQQDGALELLYRLDAPSCPAALAPQPPRV
jgi:ribosomal protein S18 acetylase RimI-like enzyme